MKDTRRVPVRGVHLSPGAGPNGETFFVGVNGSGQRVFKATIFTGEGLTQAANALWELLDQLDPPRAARPRLLLMRN